MTISRSSPSRAVVIGAGIAGLSASIALRRAGWTVTVLERSTFSNEIGAAISVPPNATRVLDHWGFSISDTQPVPNVHTRYCSAGDLSVIYECPYEHIAKELGAQSWSFHRCDLHKGLRDLAVEDEDDVEGMEMGKGRKVQIRLGCEAVGLDCQTGVVKLKDGETMRGDLVVIADGAHSRLIEDFTGQPSTIKPTGRAIYRWLVSMDDVMADPGLRAQFEGKLPGFLGWTDPGKKVMWVNYTCRGGKVLNNAVVHDAEIGEGSHDVWHSPASKEQVLETISNFHDIPKKIVDMASEDGIKAHNLFKRPPLKSFVKGRAIVVGDAAHVMMPTHAAGGAIAIESAAVLEVLFRGVDGSDEALLKERLGIFDELRIPRCNLTMLCSNAGPAWLNVPGVEEEIRRFYSGPLPAKGSWPWSTEFREVLFHHDAFAAAEAAMREAEWKKRQRLPN